MHPRGRPRAVDGRARPARARAAGLRPGARLGAPRAVDEHFSHGTVTNYWGGSSSATTHLLEAMHYRGLLRVVRREAGDPRLRGARARAGAARRGGPPRARSTRSSTSSSGSTRRCRRQPVDAGAAAALRRAPVAGRAGRALQRARRRLVARPRRGRGLVLAGRRALPARRAGRRGPPAGPVRSGGLGPAAVRDPVGLGVSLRGVHARAQAQARLLCAAAALARPRHRLGKLAVRDGDAAAPTSATSRRRRRAAARSAARWTRNWTACALFSASSADGRRR